MGFNCLDDRLRCLRSEAQGGIQVYGDSVFFCGRMITDCCSTASYIRSAGVLKCVARCNMV